MEKEKKRQKKEKKTIEKRPKRRKITEDTYKMINTKSQANKTLETKPKSARGRKKSHAQIRHEMIKRLEEENKY